MYQFSLTFLICYFLSPVVNAQPRVTPSQKEMAKLQFMVGSWRGKSTFQLGPGKAQEATGTEIARSLQNGTLMLVEGHFSAEFPGEKKPRDVHDALGIISYDAKTKRYLFHAYRNGHRQELELTLLDKQSVRWSTKMDNGSIIRFTLKIEGDLWHEVGEFSRDGKQWFPFLDMKLNKVKSKE